MAVGFGRALNIAQNTASHVVAIPKNGLDEVAHLFGSGKGVARVEGLVPDGADATRQVTGEYRLLRGGEVLGFENDVDAMKAAELVRRTSGQASAVLGPLDGVAGHKSLFAVVPTELAQNEPGFVASLDEFQPGAVVTALDPKVRAIVDGATYM